MMIAAVLVVCHANICRSPAAAALLARALPDVDIASAGVRALAGAGADPQMREAARGLGLDLSAHRATQLGSLQCMRADLILVMDARQQRFIESRHPYARGRTFRFALFDGGPPDIADPHGGPRSGFDTCLARLGRCADAWRARIAALDAGALRVT
ncbi:MULTISPECIES: protein tyrosine phosphatase [Burkholderia]|uniref:arsenate reductase/protein-tyrosine-phosphatase family protein n=1 Tax=Burkholderia TaxID=32008 RepID=UPI001E64F416|nr:MULTISPECIES: protein tyrosine phosphatase [unclassified Burkholderia]